MPFTTAPWSAPVAKNSAHVTKPTGATMWKLLGAIEELANQWNVPLRATSAQANARKPIAAAKGRFFFMDIPFTVGDSRPPSRRWASEAFERGGLLICQQAGTDQEADAMRGFE